MTQPLRFSNLLFLLSGLSLAAVPKNDAQFWSEIDTTVRIAPQTTGTLFETVRMGDKLPNPTLYGAGLQIDYAEGSWTLSGGAIFVGTRSVGSGGTKSVRLPFIAVTYSEKLFGVTISDRNRLERLEEVPGAPSRYRNRLSIDIPIHNAGPISHVFFSDEAFYYIPTSQWNRNRAQAGAGLPLSRSTELQLIFLRQDSRSGQPRALNITGTTLKVFL